MTDDLLAPEELAGHIHNMVVTDDGTLRTVVGPAEYSAKEYADLEGYGNDVLGDGPGLGVHHALLGDGQRSILLAHFAGAVYEHQGWRMTSALNMGWRGVVGDQSDVPAEYRFALAEDDDRAGFLTQFVTTPGGVVIIPQGSRAFFYDGEIAAPFGYAERPAPPYTEGNFLNVAGDVTIETGQLASGRKNPPELGYYRVGNVDYRALSIGTATGASNPHGGTLNKTIRRAKLQWIDHFGNLSPASAPSDAVVLPPEGNLTQDRKGGLQEPADALRKGILWRGVMPGPDMTVGRVVLITRDQVASGDPWYYEAPSDTATLLTAFATVPDNVQTLWFDNVPDGWLSAQEVEVDLVPEFRLGCMAFGRLWIGNWPGGEGAIRPSLPGRWGTFPQRQTIFPDPTGSEVTGMVRVARGLIVCTVEGSYLIQVNDQGDGFRAATLNATAGCVSPDSMAVLPSGLAVWLGREGWYGCDGEQVTLLSQDINNTVVRRINRGRWRRSVAAVDPRTGEYRCWVPVDGSRRNNLCAVFDGESWRTRDDVQADAVCVTSDHRGMMLALGVVECTDTSDGSDVDQFSVWALDHAAAGKIQPKQHEAVFETAWLRTPNSSTRGTPRAVQFWLRSTDSDLMGTLQVARDWLEHPLVHERDDVDLHRPDAVAITWGNAELDGTYRPYLRSRTSVDLHWTRRQPYWYKVDIGGVSDSEVFKVTLRTTGDMDVVGLLYEEIPSRKNGSSKPSKRG
jgi:hypothetical protein